VKLLKQTNNPEYCDAFNFGPNVTSNRNVKELVEAVIDVWGEGSWYHHRNERANHETTLLHVSSDRAFHKLGWEPRWDFKQTIFNTIEWYKQASYTDDHRQLVDFTMQQIRSYEDGHQKLHKDKVLVEK
jgi:CDP-glucose 4,6-dehydratase